MSGPGATVVPDLDEAMKTIYQDPLMEQIVQDSEFMNLIQRDTNVEVIQTTGGRWVEMSNYFAYPAGVGARAEGEYLPQADSPEFLNSKMYLRKIMGTLEMTGDVMKRVKSSEGAFVDYMERSLPDLVIRVNSETDRQYLGYGSGIKARVNGAVTLNTGTLYNVPIDSSFGIAGWTEAWTLFLEGERIVFAADAGGVTIRTGGGVRSGKVVSIDDDLSVLVVDLQNVTLAAAVVDNDYIASGDEAGCSFRTGAGEDREIAGILAAVDDGGIVATYNNIPRANQRLWQGLVQDASGAPFNGAFNEDLLVYGDHQVQRKGTGKTDFLLISHSSSRAYWKSLKTDRVIPDPRAYTGGKPGNTKLEIMLDDRTLPFQVARKLPPEVSYGLQLNTFRRLSLHTWEWDDRTGAIWNRVSDSVGYKDAFFCVGMMYEQMFCTKPRRNIRYEGLQAVK